MLRLFWRLRPWRRRHRDDWNRRPPRNYEWDRAKESLRHLLLFLILTGVLAYALHGVGSQ